MMLMSWNYPWPSPSAMYDVLFACLMNNNNNNNNDDGKGQVNG